MKNYGMKAAVAAALSVSLISSATLFAQEKPTQGPADGASQKEAPKETAPKPKAPKVEKPKVEKPKVEKPKVEKPKVEKPKVDRPKVDRPGSDRPKVNTPTTEKPRADKSEQPGSPKRGSNNDRARKTENQKDRGSKPASDRTRKRNSDSRRNIQERRETTQRRDDDFRIGRPWNRRGRDGNRSDFYRSRSLNLGNQLRIGIGGDGVRIGIGSPGRRDYRSNDWRNWNSDYYGRHRWYRGSWNGDWYGRYDDQWNRAWRRQPAAISFGMTRWGLNRMGYWFGYNRYHNPYYHRPVVIDSTTIDYSYPLVAAPPEYDDETSTLTEFDRARDSFKERRYADALDFVNQAIESQPRDATLHEFRALVLFARADYRDAAETLNPVLAVGPGWDWATLRGLYSSVAEYAKHLRALENYVEDHDKQAYAHFLLSYFYLTTGYTDEARTHLRRTVELEPRDEVAKQLLVMLDEEPKVDEPLIAKFDGAENISSRDLIGSWNAKQREATIRLQLKDDMSFVWIHREGKRTTEISGTYAIQNGLLALEPEAGGVMLASISLKEDNLMQFRMIDSERKDSGLTFSK